MEIYCLTLSQTNPVFYVYAVDVFRKHCGKRRNASNEQFLLFPHCFLPFGEVSAIFIKFENVVCKLFQLKSLKSIVLGKG